jgi:GntR family transcriptional regulator
MDSFMESSRPQPGNGPLYQQIKKLIVGRIVDGTWTPGQRLPSETRLGQEMGASQGTVRKALDDLVAENLLIRHQGRGTFVATHTAQRELFHFFHLVDEDGIKLLPAYSQLIDCSRRRANQGEIKRLRLSGSAHVISITRIRHLNDCPAIYETITLPAACFPDFENADDIPNELYGRYENSYGVTIHKATERLRAVAAYDQEAEALGIKLGAPLLEIDRIAETLDGTPVEWRVSRCDSRTHSYLTEIV